jgi:two-component system cell cycle sensor histidine kinase/response regulator CckA
MESESAEEEVARLKVLLDCHILDTPPEELFDRTTRLAAYLCGTPIGFVGFIDASRQWFKSRIGWDYQEIPREDSICEQTILRRDLVIVPDLTTDHRFSAGALVRQVGIRFYAGAPLLTKEGYALGTLAVMDRLPREICAEHKGALLTLARLLTAQLEMRRGAMVDVSEHKRHEAALRDSQERLFSIISSAMDAIITVDDDQRVVVFNKAAEQIFRCKAEDVIGHSLDRFIPKNLREAHREHIRHFGATGVSSRSMYSPGMIRGVRDDGEEFPIEATISQVQASSKTLYTVILRDVSVRMRTEEELRQAQKMEALGQLAGGVAHEFNNYLSIIMGYGDLLAEEGISSEALCRSLGEIKNATQKAASLTRQLLAFSRKQIIEPSVLDLNAAIWDAHKLLRRLIPANIEVIPVLQQELGRVEADPAQIQQILINLVVNARDAMPRGGKITIETAEVALDEEYASAHPDVQEGNYVVLSVVDTGQGIDPETLPHVFEPFFTTKQEGKGTGLGLSTTYGIVKQSSGHITVASLPGKGTTFRIYFPKVPFPVETLADIINPEAPAQRSKTILVVEDESALRRLIRITLEGRGYRILEAKDGAEALSILERNLEQIDLVVTDLVMPHMTGIQLREKAAVTHPSVKFLLISGYAEELTGGPEQVAEFADFLEKPFFPGELARRVQRLTSEKDAEHEQPTAGVPSASNCRAGGGGV